MLVTQPANPAATGPDGVKLVAEAEKLEALLWEQVLTCMTKSALPASALGTGSDLYTGMVTQALSSTLFGGTDSTLTQQIVGQLQARATAAADTAAPQGKTTVEALSTRAGGQLDKAVSYARSVWPAIKETAASLGVPPVALLAQSALETGWGASAPGNNLFGIKAIGGEAATVQNTTEEIGGLMTATQDRFAAYDSGTACLTHYAGLIRRAYPQAVGAASVAEYASALVQGGYATDSHYAQKIVDTAQSPMMRSVLQAVEGDTP
ncbi:MAG: glucosaminidase domain-containing protein [Paracoccaceae bacterium]|nr:glucosaminidase domain-containing protein [Paracoccaceae bacterium]